MRNLVYKGLLASFSQKTYFRHFLENNATSLDPRDFGLALEIGHGVIKQYRFLQTLAKKLLKGSKLPAKKKERILLYLALYQWHFLDKIPLHAITQTSVAIAKAEGMRYFSSFLNAFLRKLPPSIELEAPGSLEEFADYYSYPSYFVERLFDQYGEQRAIELLSWGNRSPKLFMRYRDPKDKPSDEDWTTEPFVALQHSKYTNSPNSYIQNPTPYFLLKETLPYLNKSNSILDLCAAPGGKSLALFDLIGEVPRWVVNDPSDKRCERLEENLSKYNLPMSISKHDGRHYPNDELFDLIILDVPCSNSGTLARKAEARWRLEKTELDGLKKLQEELLLHASTLLKPNGQILYLTCSLLREENEETIEVALNRSSLKRTAPYFAYTPLTTDWDGGFCTLLSKT